MTPNYMTQQHCINYFQSKFIDFHAHYEQIGMTMSHLVMMRNVFDQISFEKGIYLE